MNKVRLLISCAFGIEKILKYELIDLGVNNFSVSDGKIEFEGELSDICKYNINLRVANKIFIKLSEFEAKTFDELFEGVKKISWEKFLPQNAFFPISKVNTVKSKLLSKRTIQSITKKAIVEKLKQNYKVERFLENGDRYEIHIKILNDKVLVLLNTSGESLNKRGYREKARLAPLKETLASAIVKIACRNPERYIILDPFCGSGTILIEASMIAKNIAPNLSRSFDAEKWDFIPKTIWDEERKNAQSQIKNEEKLIFYGSDKDALAIKIAKENAKKAKVDKHIIFSKQNINEVSAPDKVGIIITNPPYGERLENEGSINDLYKDFKKILLSRFPNWDYFILTSNNNFLQNFSLKPDKNRKLYNGKLLCYLYQYYNMKKNN